MAATTDYLPKRESDLVVWGNTFDAGINLNPVAVGLTILQAADFTAVNTPWVAAFNVVSDNATRTPAAIQTKNTAKAAMILKARELAQIIQNFPGTTNAQRTSLGLTVPDIVPTPVPVPTSPPTLNIVSVLGQTMKYTLRDPLSPTKRGKPDGVSGATIFAFVGDTPPITTDGWQTMGLVTRTNNELTFSATIAPAGSKVWVAAAWYNPRGQAGPLSAEQAIFLPGGLTQAA